VRTTEVIKEVEKIDGFGNIICPYCACNIIPPEGCYLIKGEAKCPICKQRFILPVLQAQSSNELRALYLLRDVLYGVERQQKI